MARQLLQRIDAIRRRVQFLVWTRAVCIAVAGTVVAVALFMLLDCLLRLDAPLVRLLWLIGCFVVMCVVAIRWIRPAVNYRPRRVDIARRIENSSDGWKDELTTSIQLSSQLQTNELESDLIDRSWQRLSQTPVRSLTRWEILIKPALFLVGVAAVCGLIFAAQKSVVLHSLKRIAMPWSDADWPKQNRLVLEPLPNQIARGSNLQIGVRDENGNLAGNANGVDYPKGSEDVVAEITSDSLRSSRFVNMFAANQPGHFVCELTDVQNDFSVRVSGGDDRTEWRRVRVVDFPGLQSSTIQWRHPEFNGGETRTINGKTNVWPQATFSVEGVADTDLESAAFLLQVGNHVHRHELKITNDAKRFAGAPIHLTGSAEKNISCWFELTSTKGIASGELSRTSITVITDEPPVATIAATELVCGLRSQIDVRVRVLDELKSLSPNPLLLVYQDRIEPNSLVASIPLNFESALEVDKGSQLTRQAAIAIDTEQFDMPLRLGRLVLDVALSDLSNQPVNSTPLEIPIVPNDQLLEKARQMVKQLAFSINELQTQQTVLLSQTDQYIDSEKQQNSWQIQQIIARQRGIHELIDDGPRSTVGINQMLIEYLERHRIDWSEQATIVRVRQLQQQMLDQVTSRINRELDRLEKTIKLLPDDGKQNADPSSLRQTQADQLQLIGQIARLLGNTTGYDDVANNVKQIRDRLSSLLNDTLDIQQRVISNPASNVADELNQLFSQQSRLRSMTEQLQIQLDELSTNQANQPASTHQRFYDAWKLASDGQLLSNMLKAESSVSRQQLGQAHESQTRALEILDQIDQLLSPGTNSGLQGMNGNLADRINELTRKLQEFDSELNRHANSSNDIAQSTRNNLDQQKLGLEKQLVDLQNAIRASQFAELENLVQQAAESVVGSSNSTDPNSLKRESANIQKAIGQLKRVALQMAQKNQPKNEDTVDLAKVLEFLLQLATAQETINQWTSQRVSFLNSKKADREEAANTVDNSGDVAETQNPMTGLQEQVKNGFESVSQSLDKYPTANILTESIAASLAKSFARLEQSLIDSETEQVQRGLLTELTMLIQAIEIQLESNRDNSEVDSDDPDNENEGQSEAAGISSFELTMLYVLQTGIQKDTESLTLQLREAGEETDSLRLRRQALAERQTKVVSVLDRLLQKTDESIPSLPDF